MAIPVVGITSYREQAQSGVWDVQAVFLPWNYPEAFIGAGAAVAILPPQPALPDAVAAVLDGLDGLVVTGGQDLDPAHYGAEPHPSNDEPRDMRDWWELALAAEALKRGMPYLGICRGAQVLNVVRGGTLIQHVPDVVGHKRHEGEDGVFGSMAVSVSPDSRLAALHPLESTVPVYHHQAIESPGEGLVVTARSEDNIVEAIEDPAADFCLAVQWHPEQDTRPELFAAFVAAAAEFRATRTGVSPGSETE